MSPPDLAARAEAEVFALHAFLVDWFAGRGEAAGPDRADAAFHTDFFRVAPDGMAQDRADVVAMIARGRASLGSDFEIDIALEAAMPVAQDVVLLRYVEHQATAAWRTARRVSALLVADPSAPEGVAWLWLHETWIDQTKA